MNKLSLLVFIQLTQTALTSKYEMRCPAAGEWRFRGNKFNCSNIQYVCLFRSPGDIYHESCDGLEFSSTGSKLIFEPFLNKADCSNKRYQPFTFSTDGNSNCVYQKSICNEKGQYVFDQNSLKSDRTCGCYLSKGYEFVSKPKHKRYCIPSEEDCSCHRVPCNNREKPCPQNDDEMKTRQSLEDNLFKKLTEDGLINTLYTFSDGNNGRKYRRYCIYVITAFLIFMIIVAFIYERKENENLKQEDERKRKENENLKQKDERKSKENEKLKQENETKRKENEKLKQEEERKSKENEKLKQENETKEEKLKKLESDAKPRIKMMKYIPVIMLEEGLHFPDKVLEQKRYYREQDEQEGQTSGEQDKQKGQISREQDEQEGQTSGDGDEQERQISGDGDEQERQISGKHDEQERQ